MSSHPINKDLISNSQLYPVDKLKMHAIEKASQNGLLLKDELARWNRVRDVVEAAVKQNPLAIRYAPRFQNDKAMALIAVGINGLARFWLSSALQEEKDILELSERNLPQEYSGVLSENKIFSAAPYELLPIEYAKLKLEKPDCSYFLRDSHVTLLSGGHLLPYQIKDPCANRYLMAMLPHSANHFLMSIENEAFPQVEINGKGFKEYNVYQAMTTAYDFGIPFKRGRTCIEGGNCFLFISNNERKAIVGELSIFLSMIALDEQGLFEKIGYEKPSLDAYRIARNLAYYINKQKPLDEKWQEHFSKTESFPKDPKNDLSLEELKRDELNYYKFLVAPVSKEDQIKYFDEARKIEAKIKLTKAYIAKEIDVPLKNIAFVPQTKVHLDLEMFVTYLGVSVHDDQKTVEFLDEIKNNNKLNEKEDELYTQYKKTAYCRAQVFKEIQKKRTEILQKINIDFHPLPAVFEDGLKSALNYCNGLLVKKESGEKSFTFITTGPSMEAENIFHKNFIDVFSRTFPGITFKGVPNMSAFIARHRGGIHCLTFENSLALQ